MRVLHIWDIAGVPSLMCRSLKRAGIESKVLMRASHDTLGFSKHYGSTLIDKPANAFILDCINEARTYDIVHIHAAWSMVIKMREAYPRKKIVFQHHGNSDTQSRDYEKELKPIHEAVNDIAVATRDLHKYLNDRGVTNTLIENAVDTDLFKPMDCEKSDKALAIDIRYINIDWTKEFTLKHTDWDIEIFNRETNYIHFKDMPQLLNSYKRFIDVKCPEWLKGKPVKAYSKTGREALACGLEVLNYDGNIVSGLPIDFTPEYQVQKLLGFYG